MTSFYGADIWIDGENIYYFGSNKVHKILDKSTSTWSDKTWINFPSDYLTGQDI